MIIEERGRAAGSSMDVRLFADVRADADARCAGREISASGPLDGQVNCAQEKAI